MKVIPLTRGWVAWVDDEDYQALGHLKWHTQVKTDGRSAFAARATKLGNGKQGLELMHRTIMRPEEGMVVDHIEHRTAEKVVDNRRSNLRICTIAENSRNRRKIRSKSSVFKGVCWHKVNQRWAARLGGGGEEIVGYFRDEAHAAMAYDLAAYKRFDKFARLNFEYPEGALDAAQAV